MSEPPVFRRVISWGVPGLYEQEQAEGLVMGRPTLKICEAAARPGACWAPRRMIHGEGTSFVVLDDLGVTAA